MPTSIPKSEVGEPTWEIATIFPAQGEWTEEEYLELKTNKLVEFCDGRLEVLAVPTELHQLIAFFLAYRLREWADPRRLGVTLIAPFRIRVRDGRFREPDVMFMLETHRDRRQNQYWNGADLVMEVISEDDPNRDLVTKRQVYAETGIAEYWIIDPRDHSIIVLSLDTVSQSYLQAGRYCEGETAMSKLLPGFEVDVRQAFAQH